MQSSPNKVNKKGKISQKEILNLIIFYDKT